MQMRREDEFEDDKLIGEFAEAVVKALFEASGFVMYRFGIEHLLPAVIGALHEFHLPDPAVASDERATNLKLDLIARLRYSPDFLAISAEPNASGVRDIFPVEVKFRTERDFSNGGAVLRTLRFSREGIAAYRSQWPTTLLVVVCYRAQKMIGTRVCKLREVSDARVAMRDSVWRGSWFYNVRSCDFQELARFRQGWFDAQEVNDAVNEIISFAEEVRRARYDALYG
jgi:hypothetical protein